jgi:hypothetical protein
MIRYLGVRLIDSERKVGYKLGSKTNIESRIHINT